MNDDLFRNLGAAARGHEDDLVEDPRLEKLLRGELSADEIAALEAEAKTSPDLALALRLFRPHTPEEKRRVLERVIPPPKPTPISSWVKRGAAFAMSAAAAYAFIIPPPPLPAYTQAIAVVTERGPASPGAEQEILTLSPGAHLDISLNPVEESDVPVRARAFLLRGDEVREWSAPFTYPADGKAALAGVVSDLFQGIPEGRWELVLAVGREDVLGSSTSYQELSDMSRKEKPDVRILRRSIDLEGEATRRLAEVDTLRKSGDYVGARALLAPLLQDNDGPTRARATAKLARIEAATAKSDEDLATALQRYHTAIAMDREHHLVREEHLDSHALSYALAVRARFDEARAALDALPPPSPAYPDAEAQTPYYRGVIGKEAGDYGRALQAFEEAEKAARKLGLNDLVLDATRTQISMLIALGRLSEAAAKMPTVLAAVEQEKVDCKRAELLDNVGYFELVLQPDSLERTERTLESAIALYRGACPRPRPLANALTSLAEVKLKSGYPEDARRAVASARATLKDAGAARETDWLRLEGQANLAAHRPKEALAAFQDLEKLGADGASLDAAWTAAVGRAQALESLGKLDEAEVAYAEAEKLVARRAITVPLGTGRDTFLSQLADANQREVDFLLRHRSPERAALAARRSRARSLALLRWTDRVDGLSDAERKRWNQAVAAYRKARSEMDASPADPRALAAKVSAAVDDALSIVSGSAAELSTDAPLDAPLDAPKPGEVFLVYHPIPEGWAGFAVTSKKTTAATLGAVPPTASDADLAKQLLTPFEAELGRAQRVRILAQGALGERDLHALPWKDKPLVASFPIAYGLDLGRPTREAPTGVGGSSALIVGDPTSNLATARDEAEDVANLLRAKGLTPRLLLQKDATSEAVRGALALSETSLFHYAGHADFDGPDGWQSGLPLAAGGWLGIGDILVLPRAPEVVVLSGCETAQATRALGLGLAQAFLMAGSESVVASTRKVDDGVARQVMSLFYRSSQVPGVGNDTAAALRDASLAFLKEGQVGDWVSFRVMVP